MPYGGTPCSLMVLAGDDNLVTISRSESVSPQITFGHPS